MNQPEIVVGFKPESTEAPAHFFIACGQRAVCAAPIETIDLEDFAHHASPMIISMWEELTGEHNESPHLVGAILTGWINALHQHNTQLRDTTATRH